jgi:FKBP-type peptidyl-prolyl cis-trans isomerase
VWQLRFAVNRSRSAHFFENEDEDVAQGNVLFRATAIFVRHCLTSAAGLRNLPRTITDRTMKVLRFSMTLAAALCLTGCNQPAQTTSESPATNAGAAPAAAAPAGEMKTTASGLKYQVLKQGTGTVSPKATDTVKVHYHGTLLNGTVFDSSVQRGEPISFPLNQVIRGWTEGLQLMKVGDKFRFEIPPGLAYGPQSPSPLIPPNSTLVFEVELLGIQ